MLKPFKGYWARRFISEEQQTPYSCTMPPPWLAKPRISTSATLRNITRYCHTLLLQHLLCHLSPQTKKVSLPLKNTLIQYWEKKLTDSCDSRLGFIIFRRYGDIVHPIYRGALKLWRVACSSATAIILAAAETTDTLLYLQEMLNEFYYTHTASIVADSKDAFELSTLIRKPTKALDKVAIVTIREAFCARLFPPYDVAVAHDMLQMPSPKTIAQQLQTSSKSCVMVFARVIRLNLHAFPEDLSIFSS